MTQSKKQASKPVATKPVKKQATKPVKTISAKSLAYQKLSDSDHRQLAQRAAHKAHVHQTFQFDRENRDASTRKEMIKTLATFTKNLSKPARAYYETYLAE
jgi:hypothetical protein